MELNYELIDETPRPRRKTADPITKYDFCKIFSSITNRPLGLFLKETKAWPMDWLYSIQSECKEKPREKQAIYINWFIKQAKSKEI